MARGVTSRTSEKPRAKIFKVGHGIGKARQNRGLLRGFQKLVGNFAVPVGQFAAHVLPILAVAPAGFVGGADQHVRNATHGGNHHHYFRPLGMYRRRISATFFIRSALPTEVPPNFMAMSGFLLLLAIGFSFTIVFKLSVISISAIG